MHNVIRNVLARSMVVCMLGCFLLIGGVAESWAFEKEGYNTPDTMTQQVSPGQVKESYTGIGLTGNTKIYTTLTSRYRFRGNDIATDQDFYQYLRVHTDPMKLGSGTVRINVFARFAKDIDGDNNRDAGSGNFYFFRDILDAELNYHDFAPRLYMGTVSFDGVIKNTVINLGRLNLAHLNTFQLDGGDVNVKLGDKVFLYAYGGKPVSFFFSTSEDTLAGGGAAVKVTDRTTLSAEYVHLHVKGGDDDLTKVRIDQLIPHGNIALSWTLLDDASTVSAEIIYEVPSTATLLTAKYEGLLRDISINSVDNNDYIVNPLTNILGDESKYNKYSVGVYQPFLKHFAGGVNFTQRTVSGVENYNNRGYSNVKGKFDIYDLPFKNSYISFSADYWGVKDTATTDKNNSIGYGVQLGQKINKEMDVWGGTAYNRYERDVNPNINTDRRQDWGRSYYVGGQYQAAKRLSFMTDLSMEHTNVYSDISNDLNTNYKAEVWANLLF